MRKVQIIRTIKTDDFLALTELITDGYTILSSVGVPASFKTTASVEYVLVKEDK